MGAESNGSLTVLPGKPVWLPKLEAAKFLDISPRQLERYAARGNVETQVHAREHGRGRQALYARVDLEAIAAGHPNSHAVPITEEEDGNGSAEASRVNPSQPVSTAVAGRKTGGEEIAAGILQRLAANFVPAAPERPWLTLAEAAEYSGLPAAWLRRQARAGAACAMNVGSPAAPRWRFSRELLRIPAAVRPGLPAASAPQSPDAEVSTS